MFGCKIISCNNKFYLSAVLYHFPFLCFTCSFYFRLFLPHPSAPTASTLGPCPTISQISRTPKNAAKRPINGT